MGEINTRQGRFVKVPREIYQFVVSVWGANRAVTNFFETLAAKTESIAKSSAVKSITSVTVSGAYTVLQTDGVIFIDASAGDVTITHLPALGLSGSVYSFKRTDSTTNNVILSGIIDRQATTNLYPYESIDTQSDGTDWWII